MKICGAKLRGKDQRCRQWAMPNGRCRLHGGKSLGGVDSPTFKHGRYSKVLARTRGQDEQVAEPEFPPGVGQEIALLRARIRQLIEREKYPDCAFPDWVRRLRAAYRAGDQAALAALFDEASMIVPRRRSQAKTRAEIRRTVDVLRRVINASLRRTERLRELVPPSELQHLAIRLRVSIRRHARDPAIAEQIEHDAGLVSVVSQWPES
jgi:hypothetical protein